MNLTRLLERPVEAEWVLCKRCRTLTDGERFARGLGVPGVRLALPADRLAVVRPDGG